MTELGDIRSILNNETALAAFLKKVHDDQRSLERNTDELYILVNAIIVYFIQAGFGFLECGSVRAKNATNILLKNLLDSFIGAFAYWWLGWALAYGDGNGFMGYTQFGLKNLGNEHLARWFFQYTFAATTATIVSGAVAERCSLTAYFTYSFMLTGIVYPIVSHWAWSPVGWLYSGVTIDYGGQETIVRYQDFAGSGAVHTLGGVAAFMGALFVGPRLGRFDENGKPVPIPGHSVPLVSLGAFILVMGFFSFNGGSLGQISQPGQGSIVALITVNTVIAASSGSVTCIVFKAIKARIRHERIQWSMEMCILGALAGMVAVCSGCDVYRPWAAMVVGVIGGFCLLGTQWAVLRVGVDDPLDATAVHAGPGLWGVIAAALFDEGKGILYKWDKRSGVILGWNLVGVSVIIVWTIAWSCLIFGVLKKLKFLRVDREIEEKGLDYIKHGEVAYPNKAQGDGWYNRKPRYSMDLTSVPTESIADVSMPSIPESTAEDSHEPDGLKHRTTAPTVFVMSNSSV